MEINQRDLYRTEGSAFLQECRRKLAGGPRGVLGGATDTRLLALAPKDRFEESEQKAIDWLVKSGTRVGAADSEANPRTPALLRRFTAN